MTEGCHKTETFCRKKNENRSRVLSVVTSDVARSSFWQAYPTQISNVMRGNGQCKTSAGSLTTQWVIQGNIGGYKERPMQVDVLMQEVALWGSESKSNDNLLLVLDRTMRTSFPTMLIQWYRVPISCLDLVILSILAARTGTLLCWMMA